MSTAAPTNDTAGFLDELRDRVRERNFLSGPSPLTRMLLAGELTRPEVQEWARQFHLRTQAFSRGIAYMFAKCPDLPTRRQIAENLYEEETGKLSGTAPHVDLFAKLARSLGVSDAELAGAEPDDATQGFIDYIDSLAGRSFAEVVAAMAIGSETTARDGALRLSEALRTHYGADTQFFDLHVILDDEHAEVGEEFILREAATPERRELMRAALDEHLRQYTLWSQRLYERVVLPRLVAPAG